MLMEQVNVLGFWNRVDEIRNGTLEEMANGTGISQGTIRNLRSRKMLPNLADTVVIAEYLGVSLDWLVLGKVSTEKTNELSRVLKAYEESDTITKMLVLKVLGI